MKLHSRYFVAALMMLFPGFVLAQSFPPDSELVSLLESRVAEGRAVGIVLGVMDADGSTRTVWFGDAGPEARGLSEKSLFEIGSITKVFTGILLADMVARGEVALSDPVAKYLPEGVSMPSRGGRQITLLDLATHRSGLPGIPANMMPADMSNPYADYTVEQMYDFLSSHELRRDIGSEYEYSNLAVGLLGHVLARVAGGSYEEVLRKRILDPLSMTMTGIELRGEMKGWMTQGHNELGEVVPLWDLPTLAGAGALRSNMVDMLRFLDANLGAPGSQLERSMRDSHEERTSAGPDMGVGLNWHIRKVGDRRIVWHNGGTAGFRTFLGFDPDEDIGVVVLTNSGHGADDIGFHLINPDIPLAPPPEPPKKRTAIEVDEKVLETYVGEYQLAPSFSIAITLEDGALYAQATGQGKSPIFAETETDFFSKVIDAQVTFTRNDAGEVTGLILHQGGVDQPAPRVGSGAQMEAPAERNRVDVAEEILETYVGEYQLAPTFSIAVTLDDGALFVQATGQPRFPVFAESETKFFLEAVDAQLSFTRNDAGEVTGLVLHQNGADQPAVRVK